MFIRRNSLSTVLKTSAAPNRGSTPNLTPNIGKHPGGSCVWFLHKGRFIRYQYLMLVRGFPLILGKLTSSSYNLYLQHTDTDFDDLFDDNHHLFDNSDDY
jgi:hypothetical protein